MTTSRRSRQTTFDGGSEETLLPTPGYVSGGRSWPRNVEWRDNSAYRENGVKVQVHLHHVVETLGFLPPATPASRSATPGSGPARMTPGTSGRTFADCLPDFQPTSRIGWFSRTFAATSAWGSTVCSMTWTTSATPRGRSLYLLRVSARSTAGTGSGSSDALTRDGLFTTPTTDASRLVDKDGNPPAHFNQRLYDRETGRLAQHSLTQDVLIAERMWPTPETGHSPNGHGIRGGKPGNGHQSGASLAAAVLMYPTPDASGEKFRLSGDSQQSRCLEVMARRGELDGTPPRSGQKLNPAFVSRLMGYPDGWLDLSDSDPA